MSCENCVLAMPAFTVVIALASALLLCRTGERRPAQQECVLEDCAGAADGLARAGFDTRPTAALNQRVLRQGLR
jgi:hypothetical protein